MIGGKCRLDVEIHGVDSRREWILLFGRFQFGNRRKKAQMIGLCFLSALLLVMVPMTVWGAESSIPTVIRVGLATQAASQEFSVGGEYVLLDQGSGAEVATMQPGENWQVRMDNGKMELLRNGTHVGIFDTPLLCQKRGDSLSILSATGSANQGSNGLSVVGAGDRINTLDMTNGTAHMLSREGNVMPIHLGVGEDVVYLSTAGGKKGYRGTMLFKPLTGSIVVINQLPLEQYLYSVVAAEMPSSWPLEALKAQAVVARSYALAQMATKAYEAYGFDILATQQSQVYGGIATEAETARLVVDNTQGQTLHCNGQVVMTVFHSSSGGYTENSEDIWKDALPYIRWKEDPFDKNEHYYGWQVSFDQQALVNQLNKSGYTFASISNLEVGESTASGARVKRLIVTGLDTANQPLQVEIGNADTVRMALGFNSALFTMEIEKNEQGFISQVLFTGNGFGHGLGMSQYGALGMAKEGYGYQDILAYYYSNCTLKTQ